EGDLYEIAHDLLDIAADIADLGELGRLDLEEGRLRQARQAARDLGLADAGRADHQDVLGLHLLAQALGRLLPAPAIAERHGDGALGLTLADDEAVELGDDLARAEASALLRSWQGFVGGRLVHRDSIVRLRLVKTQISAAMPSALRAMSSALSPSISMRARAAASA